MFPEKNQAFAKPSACYRAASQMTDKTQNKRERTQLPEQSTCISEAVKSTDIPYATQ